MVSISNFSSKRKLLSTKGLCYNEIGDKNETQRYYNDRRIERFFEF